MKSDPLSCEQSLIALSSAPAGEIIGDSPLARHVAGCPDCSRVAQVVIQRERARSLALDPLTRGGDPVVVDDAAMIAQEREGTVRFVRWVVIGVVAVAGWFGLGKAFDSFAPKGTVVETMTIPLTCLKGDQARSLVQPYFTQRSDNISAFSDPPALTLRGRASELAHAKSVIDEFEARYKPTAQGGCELIGPKVTPPPTPTATPGH
jgi:hypothetical protein